MHNLRHLSYVVAAAEHGSITEAAKKLLVSQPAISAAIKGLEDEFGFRLFIRAPAHGLNLTPPGRKFVRDAKKLLDEVEDFQRRFKGLSKELTGHLEIGCYAPSAPFLLPPIINELARRHPQISIGIHEGNLEEVVHFLKTGSLEVALTYDMYLDGSIRFEKLSTLTPYALLSSKDPMAKKKIVSLEELANKPMVLLDIPGFRDYFHNYFAMYGLQPVIQHRPKTFEMVRSLVSYGKSYSFGFIRLRNNRSYDGRQLVCRPLKEEAPNANIVLAFPKHYRATQLVEAFAERCRRFFRGAPPR